MGLLAGVAALAATLGLAACGGGDERQDAAEPEGEFPVTIESATFPREQRLAETTDFTITVRNEGDETVPELAVTIATDEGASGPFMTQIEGEELSDPNRPVWVLENEYPKVIPAGADPDFEQIEELPTAGAEVAQTNTFGFGPLEPGESRELLWRVTPVKAGTFRLSYEVAAGLHGLARAVTPGGGAPEGEILVTISDTPPRSRVGPGGEVIIEPPEDERGGAGAGGGRQGGGAQGGGGQGGGGGGQD